MKKIPSFLSFLSFLSFPSFPSGSCLHHHCPLLLLWLLPVGLLAFACALPCAEPASPPWPWLPSPPGSSSAASRHWHHPPLWIDLLLFCHLIPSVASSSSVSLIVDEK